LPRKPSARLGPRSGPDDATNAKPLALSRYTDALASAFRRFVQLDGFQKLINH